MPITYEHKLNTLPMLHSPMIADDDQLIRKGLAAAFGNSVGVHQATSRCTTAWMRVAKINL